MSPWEVSQTISRICLSSFLFILLTARYVYSNYSHNESTLLTQIVRDRPYARLKSATESWIGIHTLNEEELDTRLDTSAPRIYDFFEIPVATRTSLERVAFTSTKPTHIPAFHQFKITTEKREIDIFKRQVSGLSVPISACSSRSSWETLYKAVDVNSNGVTVGRNQFFWITRCLAEGGGCHGFTDTATKTSECRPEYKWQLAWGKPDGQPRYRWLHIAVPTCCSCAVTFETRTPGTIQ